MKTRLVIASIALLTASLALAQEKRHNGNHSAAEQEILRMEHEISLAVVKGDATPIVRYAAPTCTFTNPDGSVSDKAAIVASIKSGKIKYKEEQIEDMRVRVYGNTAVANFRTKDTLFVKGQDVSGRYQWTDTFVKMDGRWQLVADQGTAVATK